MRGGGLPLWGCVAGGIPVCLLSVAPSTAWKGCYCGGEAWTSLLLFPGPSSLLPDQGKDPPQWSWEGGEEAGRSPAEAAAARGAEERLHLLCLPIALQAEPTEFPFARRSVVPTLRIEAAHHSPRAASARRHRGSRPVHPGDAAAPGPTARPRAPALTTRPGPAGRARRGGRRPLRAPGSARAAASRPLLANFSSATPPGGGPAKAGSCYPETEGGKPRPPPAPARSGAATAGNKGDKAASAGPGSAPSPPRPPAAPPAAQARLKQPGEPGARPRAARDPAFQPSRLCTCRGRGLDPSLARGRTVGAGEGRKGCTPAVAKATRMAAGGARRAEPRDPAAPLRAQSPAGPHLRASLEPKLGARHGRGRTAGAGGWGSRSAPDVWWCFARPPPACLPAPGGTHAPHLPRQPPPLLSGALSSLLPAQYLAPVAILLQLSLPELRGAWFLPTGPNSGTLKRPSSPSGPHLWLCGKSAGRGLGLGLRHH